MVRGGVSKFDRELNTLQGACYLVEVFRLNIKQGTGKLGFISYRSWCREDLELVNLVDL